MTCFDQTVKSAAVLVALAGALGLPVTASGAEPAAVIEQRQEGFKTMGKSIKAIRNAMKSGATNTDDVKQAALAIQSQAGKIAEWFPAGSGAESGVATDALPYIWKNTEKFDRITQELIAASAELVSVTAAGEDVNGAFRATAKTCKGCHQSYRAD